MADKKNLIDIEQQQVDKESGAASSFHSELSENEQDENEEEENEGDDYGYSEEDKEIEADNQQNQKEKDFIKQLNENIEKFKQNLKEGAADDHRQDGTLIDCIRYVEQLVEQSDKHKDGDQKDKDKNFLSQAEELITDYISITNNNSESELFELRAEINLRQNQFIQALHDYEKACQLNPTIQTAKSSQEHYQITKSLMRMSNDV